MFSRVCDKVNRGFEARIQRIVCERAMTPQ